ncbi:MAG: aminoglycoside phosphotransferase family protein [Alphaproteobacteria bacterium]|nr:aminoglycoside phosphotransferase family protein [Alphaproteobacteria bacterium]
MEIIKTLGNGKSSNAYLIKNEFPEFDEEYVVYKEPIATKKIGKWLNEIHRETCISNYMPDVKGCHIIRTKLYYKNKKWFSVASFIKGVPFTLELFNTLPKEEQDDILYNTANFLYKMHDVNITRFNETYADVNDTKGFEKLIFILKSMFFKANQFRRAFFKNKKKRPTRFWKKSFIKLMNKKFDQENIDKNYRDIFWNQWKILRKEQGLQKYFGLCHFDMSSNNIVYDTEKKSIGIIDFGLASLYGNVYEEFTEWQNEDCVCFLKDNNLRDKVIELYNQIAKEHKSSKRIDPKLVDLFAPYSHIIAVKRGFLSDVEKIVKNSKEIKL